MSYQSDIKTAIAAATSLANELVGGVWPDVADGSAQAPYLVYQTISSNGETALDGSRGIRHPLVQFTVWARTKAQACDLISQVRETLEGRNLPGASNLSFSYSNEQSTYDPETKLFGEMLDLRGSCGI